jgi:hypothetical protein
LIATTAALTRSTTRARSWDKLCNVLMLSDIVSIKAPYFLNQAQR